MAGVSPAGDMQPGTAASTEECAEFARVQNGIPALVAGALAAEKKGTAASTENCVKSA
jgi:hypothetical protein